MIKLLPYQQIKDLIKNNYIVCPDGLLQPASLDVLCLNDELRIKKNDTVELKLDINLGKLERQTDITYMYSSRSTTARNGIDVKFNRINKSLIITPLAYNIVLPPKARLGQFYFYKVFRNEPNTYKTQKFKIDTCVEYFGNSEYKLSGLIKPNSFYLAKSKTLCKIPKDHVGILQENVDNYRTHLNAGFFDPSFKGKAVLEIVSLDALKVKDVRAKLTLVPLIEPTKFKYSGNYQNQNSIESILPKTQY